MKKTAIIYYSYSGFTADLCREMGKVLDADVIELKPKEELQEKRGMLMTLVKGGSEAILKKKPELVDYEFEEGKYDLIIIGTPVWAWTYSPPVRTFLKGHDLEGKKVVLFATHQGGPGNTLKNMATELPKAIIVSSREFFNEKGKKSSSISEARLWAGTLIRDLSIKK